MIDCPKCRENKNYWNTNISFVCEYCGKHHEAIKKGGNEMASNCIMATYDGRNDCYECGVYSNVTHRCRFLTPDSKKCSHYEEWEKEERERMDALNKVNKTDIRLFIEGAENLSHMVLALVQSGYAIGLKADQEGNGRFEVSIYGVESIAPSPEEPEYENVYHADGTVTKIIKYKEDQPNG